MEELVARSGARRRFQTALVSAFAVLALVLAAVGVYGVMGYMIAARRHEIGVRLALGALPREVVRLVLGSGLGLTLAGVAVGLAGAMALSRVLAGFVYGVSALDPRRTRQRSSCWWEPRPSRRIGPRARRRAWTRSPCCETNERRQDAVGCRRVSYPTWAMPAPVSRRTSVGVGLVSAVRGRWSASFSSRSF